ncbi:aspartate aminotransferase family protein [Jiella sp. LLJ827]|nr:aspartate aminotransferase family protein [Jiella sp. LLJ827]MCQ0989775.1 aspartate aminotransferase family protein [Jiella sp. LLJ827]
MARSTRQILDMNAFRADDAEAKARETVKRRLANTGALSVLFYREPIEMVSAEGAWMQAANGERYLDFYNNVPSVGHTHPKVVEAVTRQMGRLNIHSRYLNQVVDNYLERLKERLPDPLSNIVLTCTGSEANDLALRVAEAVTGARGVIVTETAYHGNTAAVTAISPSAFKQASPPAHVVAIPAPAPTRFEEDIAGGFAASVEEAIATLKGRGYGLSAFICDSIFSSDGVFADPAGFLRPAVEAARAAGGVYIADEVQPGFARTGDAFWGFARHGVEPDMVTMGKPMGNGFPMAGVAAKPEDLSRFSAAVGYFNTFGGNPVAAAAGAAVLSVIEEERLQENARDVGSHLLSRLHDLAARDARVGTPRGAGLFIGLDLIEEGDAHRPDPELASRLINGLKREHVLIGAAGPYGHTLKIRPPLCLNRSEADLFADTLERVLSEG